MFEISTLKYKKEPKPTAAEIEFKKRYDATHNLINTTYGPSDE